MEARAVAKYVRMSPRKVRLVVDLIRGRDVEEALNILQFIPKAAALPVEKTVRSAVYNAINVHGDGKLDVEDLYIKEIYVNEGPTLKRYRPRARGRVGMIRKRTSHITVVVAQRPEGVPRG